MPGVILASDEHFVVYKFVLPVDSASVNESTMVLINEVFNGITSTLGIVADVASGKKAFEQALEEVEATYK